MTQRIIGLSLAAATVATAAYADPPSPLSLYDARGQLIGELVGGNTVVATINDALYQLQDVQRAEGGHAISKFPDANFWYTNSTCSGQRWLLDYGEVPARAYYEAVGSPGSKGQQLWTYRFDSKPQTITVGSYWYAYGSQCVPYSFTFQFNAEPAVSLGPYPFVAPFSFVREGGR